jgi:Flp pilus assembly pilin Flp
MRFDPHPNPTETWMTHRTRALRNFGRREDGAALLEYAILVALIAVVALLVVAAFGNKVSEKFSVGIAKLQ